MKQKRCTWQEPKLDDLKWTKLYLQPRFSYCESNTYKQDHSQPMLKIDLQKHVKEQHFRVIWFTIQFRITSSPVLALGTNRSKLQCAASLVRNFSSRCRSLVRAWRSLSTRCYAGKGTHISWITEERTSNRFPDRWYSSAGYLPSTLPASYIKSKICDLSVIMCFVSEQLWEIYVFRQLRTLQFLLLVHDSSPHVLITAISN